MHMNSIADGPKTSLFSGSFWTLFFVLMFSMVGLSTILGLQMLYGIQRLGFSDREATLFFACSVSLMFTTPVIGGYLATRWLNSLITISLGFMLAIAGLYSICLENIHYYYIGMGSFITGNGCVLANALGLLSRLFPKNDHRRDRGFLVCFIGMNVGSFFALSALTMIALNWGYHFAFLACACLFVIALFVFVSINFKLIPLINKKRSHPITPTAVSSCVAALLLATMASSWMLSYAKDHSDALIVLAGIAVALIAMTALKLAKISARTLLIGGFVTITGIVFWTFYMIAPSIVTLYIERTQHHTLFGIPIPSSAFFALNPLFVILGGIAYASYLHFKTKHRTHSHATTSTMPLLSGLGCLSLAYLIMSIVYYDALHSFIQILSFYALLSVAELLILPLGLSVIARLLPSGREGLLSGIWLLSLSIGTLLSGFIAKLTVNTTDTNLPHKLGTNYPIHFLHYALLIASITALITLSYHLVQRQKAAPLALHKV